MRVYTAHLDRHRAPVLLREGFSLSALLFGPFWLLAHRAWIEAALALALYAAIGILAPGPFALALWAAAAWALGVCGQDLRRWSLERAGYLEAHVVAAPDADSALKRLLDRRPDLLPGALGLELAP